MHVGLIFSSQLTFLFIYGEINVLTYSPSDVSITADINILFLLFFYLSCYSWVKKSSQFVDVGMWWVLYLKPLLHYKHTFLKRTSNIRRKNITEKNTWGP